MVTYCPDVTHITAQPKYKKELLSIVDPATDRWPDYCNYRDSWFSCEIIDT